LESVEVIERSPPQTGQPGDHPDLDFVALFLLGCCAVWRGGGWLGNSSLSFSRSSLVSAEGCVERGKINQRVIDGGNSNLDHLHLDFCQLLQALPWASTPERAAVGDA